MKTDGRSDLALDDYKDLVRNLDPNAVPPSSPSSKAVIDPPTDLLTSPDLSMKSPTLESRLDTENPSSSTEAPSSNPSPNMSMSKSEAISNLLVGQRGVNRLFEDFVSSLTVKEKEIRRLSDRIEELEHTLSTVTDQLNTETSLRISAEGSREMTMRDDASAAKVVERYMTFTQKTHATVHLHLDNLRSRSAATQKTLRREIDNLRVRVGNETVRAERLRLALDEACENLSREVVGRRREVGLRLKMIANEEKRERRVEIWLDRVRRTREGVEGAVVEADVLETLLDEGIEAYSIDLDHPTHHTSSTLHSASSPITVSVSKDKQRSWRGMSFSSARRKSISSNGNVEQDKARAEESSIARVLLAEELVDTLVKDLQMETERRMALESQRVEWLAKEAVEGREAGEGGQVDDNVMFDADTDHHDEPDESTKVASGPKTVTVTNEVSTGENDADVEKDTIQAEDKKAIATEEVSTTKDAQSDQLEVLDLRIPLETPPPLTPNPALEELSTIFKPLRTRYDPLQSSLHSLSHSLADLRSSLPFTTSHGSSTMSRKPGSSILPFKRSPLADPVLGSILDNIHETLEDARVDVEIALADEDRVYRGFEALLGVGSSTTASGSGSGGSGSGFAFGGGRGGSVVQSKDVLKDAGEFVIHKQSSEEFGKLEKKVRDLEYDLSSIKAKCHELEGMDLDSTPHITSTGTGTDPTTLTPTLTSPNPNVNHNTEQPKERGFLKPTPSIWSSLELLSISNPTPRPTPPSTPSLSSTSNGAGNGIGVEDGRKRLGSGMFNGVSSAGRSFSASVISAPKKMGGFAGGLYRPKRKDNSQSLDQAQVQAQEKGKEQGQGQGESERLISDNKEREDDVE